MTNKTVLITGATGGIGKAAAIALAQQGARIIIHGRNEKKTHQTRKEIERITGNTQIDVLVGDLFLLEDVRRVATAFQARYDRLDVLINNAGGVMSEARAITTEGIEKTLALNLFAPFLLTNLLMDNLAKSNDARIINVSSSSHWLNARPDFNDLPLENGYTPLRAYGNAKLFLIFITQHLSAQLKEMGVNNVTVNSMHPGAVATNFAVDSNLGGVLNVIGKLVRPFLRSVEKGADTLVYLATDTDVKRISGKYFVDRKPTRVNRKYNTPENEKLIWQYCEDVTHTSLWHSVASAERPA